jgi:hypothetical protein
MGIGHEKLNLYCESIGILADARSAIGPIMVDDQLKLAHVVLHVEMTEMMKSTVCYKGMKAKYNY